MSFILIQHDLQFKNIIMTSEGAYILPLKERVLRAR